MSIAVAGRRGAVLLVLLVLASSGLLAPAARAVAGNQADQFVELANQSRDAAGLPAYVVAADLSHVAREQAARMAAAHDIFHNPNLKTDVADWYMVGENVGVGYSPQQIHDAFMASPTHRADLLSADFVEIGVGFVVGDDRRLYVSEVFRLREERVAPVVQTNAAPQPQPQPQPQPHAVPMPADAPAPPPPPAPAPTTTTTTMSIMVTTPSPNATDAQDHTEMAMARGMASASHTLAPPQLTSLAATLVAAALAAGVLCVHLAVLRRALIG